jgi:cytidylate kinase
MNVKKFVQQQAQAFEENLPESVQKNETSLPVITIAMEPGSGGYLIAESVAKRLGFTLYSKRLLTAMANKADVKQSVLEAIEKQRPSAIEDFVAALLPKDDYVYPGDYFENLKETISNIALLGRAVIVGRGANFILPKQKRFAIRVLAPLEIRIKNVAFHFKVSLEEAKKRVSHREARRKAFIKDYLRKNIAETDSYDLIINTERMDLETCTELVIGALKGAQINRAFEAPTTYILKTTS